jgi:hypothetical protein
MKKRSILLIIAVAVIVSIASFPTQSEKLVTTLLSGSTKNAIAGQEPPEVNLTIKKIDGEWKVVNDSSQTKVKAKKGAKISWTAEGTDVYFQFMEGKLLAKVKDKDKARNSEEAASLPEIYSTNRVSAGQSQSFIIRASIKRGDYPYAVFCMADSVFATGDSPPKIIIE